MYGGLWQATWWCTCLLERAWLYRLQRTSYGLGGQAYSRYGLVLFLATCLQKKCYYKQHKRVVEKSHLTPFSNSTANKFMESASQLGFPTLTTFGPKKIKILDQCVFFFIDFKHNLSICCCHYFCFLVVKVQSHFFYFYPWFSESFFLGLPYFQSKQ